MHWSLELCREVLWFVVVMVVAVGGDVRTSVTIF